MSKRVHYSDWAQQPDVRIFCTQKCTTPTWSPTDPTLPAEIYEAENGELYTFNKVLVSCRVCRSGLA